VWGRAFVEQFVYLHLSFRDVKWACECMIALIKQILAMTEVQSCEEVEGPFHVIHSMLSANKQTLYKTPKGYSSGMFPTFGLTLGTALYCLALTCCFAQEGVFLTLSIC
jgi:hypothetical protein